MEFLAGWIEHITSKLKVNLTDINVRVEDPVHSAGLLLHIPSVQFFDETPDLYATDRHSTRSIGSVGDLTTLLAHKMIRFPCFHVHLISYNPSSEEPTDSRGSEEAEAESDTCEESDSESRDQPLRCIVSATTLLSSDPLTEGYLRLKLAPSLVSMEQAAFVPQHVPLLTAEFFLRSLRLQLSPQSLSALSDLVDAFAAVPPQPSPTAASPLPLAASLWGGSSSIPADTEAEDTSGMGSSLSAHDFMLLEKLLMKKRGNVAVLGASSAHGGASFSDDEAVGGVREGEGGSSPRWWSGEGVPPQTQGGDNWFALNESTVSIDSSEFFDCDDGSASLWGGSMMGGAGVFASVHDGSTYGSVYGSPHSVYGSTYGGGSVYGSAVRSKMATSRSVMLCC